MSIRAKIVLNSVAIALFVAAAAYLYFAIDQLADEFIGLRKSDAQFFSQLIRDNWDGIRTIPEEKKKILVENLDPKWAGVDLDISKATGRHFPSILRCRYSRPRRGITKTVAHISQPEQCALTQRTTGRRAGDTVAPSGRRRLA